MENEPLNPLAFLLVVFIALVLLGANLHSKRTDANNRNLAAIDTSKKAKATKKALDLESYNLKLKATVIFGIVVASILLFLHLK